jgi:luciferase family oxidoreductase group 1
LAAALGLPFAFASHFAPALLLQAAETYREQFQPSQYLDRPYLAAGVPVVAAESDAEARYLATSVLQRGLRLIRRQPIFVPPPLETMDGLWTDGERYLVESRLALAVVGSLKTVQEGLQRLLLDIAADELIFVSELYSHSRRLHSFEIAAEAMRRLAA